MITVIIGQAGSGKTTFVMEKFYSDLMLLKKHPIKHTYINCLCLIGDYKTKDRCKGTDTLAFNSIEKIIDFIRDNQNNFDFVIEGDRINNKRFFQAISKMKIEIQVYCLHCDIKKSYERLRNAGSKITLPFLKTTRTKSENMVKYLLSNKIKVEIIET